MDKFILIAHGFIIGFTGNSIFMRALGTVSNDDIAYPIAIFVISLIVLAARLTR